jgi:epoxide hydrolase-like predicted phosphatase
MKRALLVDYGGVLTSPVVDSFASFCAREQIDVEVFRSVIMGAARTNDSPFARVETGAITQEEFDAAVAALLSDACGRAIDPTGLKQRLFAGIASDAAMVAAIRRAREAGVRTVLVSNSWGGRDYPAEILDATFDALVISGEVGLRKPDAEIYHFAADKAGVECAACVFVDDFKVNVDGANAVGMTGLLHRDATETIPKLEELLGTSLR